MKTCAKCMVSWDAPVEVCPECGGGTPRTDDHEFDAGNYDSTMRWRPSKVVHASFARKLEREGRADNAELLAIHDAVMNPHGVTFNESDTFTVKKVKEFILRAIENAAPQAGTPQNPDEAQRTAGTTPSGLTPEGRHLAADSQTAVAAPDVATRDQERWEAESGAYDGIEAKP